MNFALYDGCLDEFSGIGDVRADCEEAGIDGLEVVWDYNPYHGEVPDSTLAPGYHALFWTCWVDFWKQDHDALMREFGSWDLVREYYGGDDRQAMLARYRADFDRAQASGAEYVVFHVGEVSLEEVFTYSFAHTDEEVVDCVAELVDELMDGRGYTFSLLFENLWWPGLTFTDPRITTRLLEQVEYADKGIMLDIGHLLHTNNALRTQAEAARYVMAMLDEHGPTAGAVRGLHLHQSLTGPYVQGNRYRLAPGFEDETDYWKRYSSSYRHVLNIDKHEPWTDPSIAEVVRRIGPEWVNNELSARGRQAHLAAVKAQMDTLRRGGLALG